MAYTYRVGIFVNDANGRSLNFTQPPTITVWDFDNETQIMTPAPTLVNLSTGFYKAKITIDTRTTVAFKVVPHVDDQAAVEDIKVMQVKGEQTVEDAYTAIQALPDAVAVNVYNNTAYNAVGYNLTTGVLVSGSASDTLTLGTPLVFRPDGTNPIVVDFQFELEAANPSEFVVTGYFNGTTGAVAENYRGTFIISEDAVHTTT